MSGSRILSPIVVCRYGAKVRRVPAVPVTSLVWDKSADGTCAGIAGIVSTRAMATDPKPSLVMENLNPQIKIMQYAVRGPLTQKAGEFEKELERVKYSCFSCVGGGLLARFSGLVD